MDKMKNLPIIIISIAMIYIIGLLGVTVITAFYSSNAKILPIIFAEVAFLAVGTYFLNKLTK